MKHISMLIGILLYTPIMYAQPIEDSMEMSQGAHAWTMHCAQCHNLRAPTEFTDKSWDTIMLHMQLQAGLSKKDANEIRAFLSEPTQASQNQPPVQKNDKVAALSGEAIYKQTCVACHGTQGKGAIPGVPNFTDPNGPLKNSDAVLLERIINGYQSSPSAMPMPARGGNPNLTDDDLKKTLEYIRTQCSKSS